MEEYSVYWYDLRNYKGKGIQLFGGPRYWGVLYKIGYQYGPGGSRLRENETREGELAWVKLWGDIHLMGIKQFQTREQAIKFEKKVHRKLGKKQFTIAEKVSGVSEFRIGNKQNEAILNELFHK